MVTIFELNKNTKLSFAKVMATVENNTHTLDKTSRTQEASERLLTKKT